MATQGVERRLAAILAADVVGYSRLMEASEAETLAALRKLRSEVIDPLLAKHHGRIVKLMGDGAIAEFGSVVDAVSCAVAVQKEAAAAQVNCLPQRRIVFRIGINLGDVVVDGEDLLGDGVNVAARLEQLCEPSGVLISGTAFDQLQGKLNLPLDFRGEQQVKNIARPVRTYSVRLAGAPRDWRLDLRRLSRWRIPAAAVLLLLAVGMFTLLRPSEPRVEAASIQRMAFPLPNKPSIAVLPFDNLSSDPQQGYFADGITDDLITDLSKLSGIFVIARNSSSTYKGKPTKVQQVAEDLGVRYVLEGSVRREGDHVRINAQLIDAVGGQHVWANRYDGAMKDVFALQDQVMSQIVEALAVKLTGNESTAMTQGETTNPEAYDVLLQGWDHLHNDSQDETLKAIALFEKAIRLDPDYGRAYAALAAANLRIVLSIWEAATGTEFEHASERLRQYLAKAMQTPTSLAYAVSAGLLTQEGLFEEASAAINNAIALSPNDPEVYVSSAKLLNATGRAAEAEVAIRKALRLDPRFAPGSLRVLAISLFHQQRYQEAIDTLQRVVSQQSDVEEDYATWISCLGHLGRTDGVKDLIDKFNTISIGFGYDPLTVQEMGWWWYGDMFDYDNTYRASLQEGLRKANVPEGPGTDLRYADYRRSVVKDHGLYQVLGATEIDAPTAKALWDRGGVTFVDVRGPGDFLLGHIPGAKNSSLASSLSKENLSKIVGKNDSVIFSCMGKYCSYSAYASAKALLWGYTHVYRFAGGFPAWKDAGYPVESSLSVGQ
jgi:TolB-like protein/class 3 adenylate cyclase/rhodanese-related sulfurtransferase/Flp pilus assembly protein TadD